jgi:hypothetical protein
MLAAWAAAQTSERASVTLAPLVPDRTTTPHAADTGQMARPFPADRIAGNGSGSRPGESQRARWTWILVTNPEARIGPLFASLPSHCSAVGLAFKVRG